MKRFPYIYTLFAIAASAFTASAANHLDVEFGDESTDTTRLTQILIDVERMNIDDSGRILSEFARCFIGTPYASGTLEGKEEKLRVRTDSLDCTTFVETTLALTMTALEHRSSWRDFVYNLERLRYRGGETDGYASRLHYVSDWIVDGSHRGILQDVTNRIAERADYEVKTIDFMTRHRDKYPALADSATYERMKQVEVGYRSHRFPYIKSVNIKSARLREGDVVAFTSKLKDLDVAHMGIITIVDGTPHVIHASSKAGKVISDPLPLSEYLRKNRAVTGIRVIRLKD